MNKHISPLAAVVLLCGTPLCVQTARSDPQQAVVEAAHHAAEFTSEAAAKALDRVTHDWAPITTGSLVATLSVEPRLSLPMPAAPAKPPHQNPRAPALVFDLSGDEVLYIEEPDRSWYPASLTKLMTAYLAFEALKAEKLNEPMNLTITQKAVGQPPSKAGLHVGQKLTLDAALQVMILVSANDLAMAVAETVGGSEEVFVEKMNATAQRLGMTRSHFVNPTGLPDPQQVSSARDIALLVRAILREYPDKASLFSVREARFGRQMLSSVNGLLGSFSGADGMKTGFTCASGYNVVATAVRGDRKLVAIVLGETSRDARAKRAATLLENGFQSAAAPRPGELAKLVGIGSVPGDTTAPTDMTSVVRSATCGSVEVSPRVRRAALRPLQKDRRVLARRTSDANDWPF